MRTGPCVCSHMSAGVCPQDPEVGTRSPRGGITGGCEPPNMGAGDHTQLYYRGG